MIITIPGNRSFVCIDHLCYNVHLSNVYKGLAIKQVLPCQRCPGGFLLWNTCDEVAFTIIVSLTGQIEEHLLQNWIPYTQWFGMKTQTFTPQCNSFVANLAKRSDLAMLAQHGEHCETTLLELFWYFMSHKGLGCLFLLGVHTNRGM